MLRNALFKACKHRHHVPLRLLRPCAQSASPPPVPLGRSYGVVHKPSFNQTQRKETVRPVVPSGQDTIYALSSAPGRAGIAVVRISGLACREIHEALCKDSAKPPKARYAAVRTLYDPSSTDVNSEVLDSQAIVIDFPQPQTATGEDMLELHIHGGNATVRAVLQGISNVQSSHNIRYAEAGEFTRRGFENGKFNLAQVEALSDQLSAETEQQRRAAVRGSSAFLGKEYEGWRTSLLYARGEMEALIDFSEDQHFDESPTQLLQSITEQVRAMVRSIAGHEAASHRGELLRRGIRISLLGPPNAGKSSLLNQLVGREASIVSQEAGTTRDVVEVSLDLRGYLCTFADTAGLRSQCHPLASDLESEKSIISAVEQEGIRRAKVKASESDLVIALASVEAAPGSKHGFTIEYDAETVALAAAAPSSIFVINKCDRISKERLESLLEDFLAQVEPTIDFEKIPRLAISCQDAQLQPTTHSCSGQDPGNIHRLSTTLVSIFQAMTDLPQDLQDLLGVTERSRQLLARASAALHAYLDDAAAEHDGMEADIVIAAEHLREAADALARITGRVDVGDVEEVLGVVFEKFCVGK
ncbi:hypothetical protein BJ875DRAFT_485504 [Amylocarpus encephaloides]|uniref:tRNA modification GTPase TrmE n=1 Tax=Amylocarpus encephaloides TaxID=45428 RepID=A0A9P7YG96_9HELO|nr:hypothetical protein BJ875DRAFT_485504 [Amylocarpus encephaloides]